MSNLYAERDIIEQGDHYSRHTSAMTCEDLHSKSAIAEELAHRDIQLEQAQARVAEVEEALRYLREPWELSKILGADTRRRVVAADAALSGDRSKGFILRKQAEAVEVILDFGTHETVCGEGISTEEIADYAQRLRQQADEAERAGVEQRNSR